MGGAVRERSAPIGFALILESVGPRMLSLFRRLVKPLVVGWIHRGNERLRKTLETDGQALSPRDWGAQVSPDGSLCVGGCRLADLASRFGTPLHVLDEARLIANFQRFQHSFADCASQVEIGFSYKTNPLPGAIRILHQAGAWAEVISHFELWLALKLGMPGNRIVFNGPGKTPESLRLAVARDVRMINLDNVDEADILQKRALALNKKQPVGIRVVTSVGWAAQFGIPLEDGAAFAAFEKLRTLGCLDPCGLHIHLGTGIKDVAVYAQAVDELFAFAQVLRQKLGLTIRFIDVGGGYGVPTVSSFTAMDERLLHAGLPARPVDTAATPPLADYANVIQLHLKKHFGPARETWPTIFLEPGRAVASSAQLLLLRVLAIKPGPRDSRNVILDGGHNLAIPTSYEIHHLFSVEGLNRQADQVHHFFGPLCHPGDVLAREIRMPTLHVGDIVAVMDAGAYFIPNQMNFSNPRPAAVIVRNGEAHLTRSAETFDHMVALDREFGAFEGSHG